MHTFDFHQKCVAITGKNGSGKTNLLDAVYYLCFTKSYFNKKERNNIQYNKEGFRVSGKFKNNERKSEVKCLFKDNKKNIFIDDVKYERSSEHIGFQSAVIIAPDDISIINGYSEDRRKFFDGLLSQMDTTYLSHLLEYQRVLFQKNTYLKNSYPISRGLIEVYNEQLIQSGAYIMNKRIDFTHEFNPFLENFYHTISEYSENIQSLYKTGLTISQWREEQKNILEAEISQKRTLIGPHTDDWDFLINSMPLKTNGSQGQKKTFLLALKLSQISLLNQENKVPILLLDDIFEKLDKNRLNEFFRSLQSLDISQVFLTHTDNILINEIVKKHFGDIDLIELNR